MLCKCKTRLVYRRERATNNDVLSFHAFHEQKYADTLYLMSKADIIKLVDQVPSVSSSLRNAMLEVEIEAFIVYCELEKGKSGLSKRSYHTLRGALCATANRKADDLEATLSAPDASMTSDEKRKITKMINRLRSTKVRVWMFFSY